MNEQPPQTLTLESYALRSYNYLDQMVDANDQPYFNIFWAEPSEAAHDWPDFGDVMSRQLQAAIMARHMTGVEVPIERRWHQKMLSMIDPESGLLYRPKTGYSQHVADIGDQALTLYTLVTAYLDSRDESVRALSCRMVDHLASHMAAAGKGNGDFLSGFMIKSLMACARHMGYAPALDLAGLLVHRVFVDQPLFSPDNTFRQGGHMHGNLRTLVGCADYALYMHDPVIYSRVNALYRYVRSEATRFGFMPESIGRHGDVVLCETCALMDYIGLATTLANHGHPEYWGDVERVVRNQLIENQVTDASWLMSGSEQPDTEQFSWRDIGRRMTGGYAGWASPNHILAVRETLGAHWGGSELKHKTRAFQNCCGGSGTHAFFIAWKNASRFSEGQLSVNLHIDKLLPQAEIRCCQPYRGLLTIFLREACTVQVRIPEFVAKQEILVEAGGAEVESHAWGNYLQLGHHPAGTMLQVQYPLPVIDEDVTIGNPGFRQYCYHVTWKGDTVVGMQPVGNDWKTGYSDFDKQQVPVFYGEDGPGPLYRRQAFLRDVLPSPAPIHADSGELDLWYFGPQE